MEAWLSRILGLLCAFGGWGLLWTFGAVFTVPWHEGRLLALNRAELQAVGVPLLIGVAVVWGAAHIFAIADRKERPSLYAWERAALLLAGLAAALAGGTWALARLA